MSQASNAINPFFLERLEETGREIKKITLQRRIVGAITVYPLENLKNKNIITQNELWAAERYSQDYELSNFSKHSRPSWDGSSINSEDSSSDENGDSYCAYSKASKSVEDIRFLLGIADLDYQKLRKKIDKIRGAKKGKNRERKYLKIAQYVLENEISIKAASILLRIHRVTLENRIKEMVKIILDYYEISKENKKSVSEV